jgi:hypothetical protein
MTNTTQLQATEALTHLHVATLRAVKEISPLKNNTLVGYALIEHVRPFFVFLPGRHIFRSHDFSLGRCLSARTGCDLDCITGDTGKADTISKGKIPHPPFTRGNGGFSRKANGKRCCPVL